jgi:L-seryl-tRNA(Ser) seleniumtransferase
VRSAVGGGALPLHEPDSFAVALAPPGLSAATLEARLRHHDPPVLGRIALDRLLLDVRTVQPTDFEEVALAVHAAAGERTTGDERPHAEHRRPGTE